MSPGHFLYQLLIGPIELFFETIYGAANGLLGNNGLAIIVLSLAMNLLLLPLYRRADAIQAEERDTENKLSTWSTHIKKTFQGDERFMILQAYYRENHYKPFYALKGSLPLVLEIPFFIAAYHFLSNLEELKGTPFGLVANLGAPDTLLQIGGLTLHALPILMTLINMVSSAVYTKGLPAKDKIKLYGMALIFLVLLYDSPSGLVIYWTMNNLFSLLKNLAARWIKPRGTTRDGDLAKAGKANLFPLGCVFLALLTGVLIPSAVILSSPAEFVQIRDFYSPLRHILNAALLSFGLFVVWFSVFYYMAGAKLRKWMNYAVLLACGVFAVDYMFFGTSLGTMSAALKYDIFPAFSTKEKLLNLLVILLLAAAAYLALQKKQDFLKGLYVILIITVLGMSAVNMVRIQTALPEIRKTAEHMASLPGDEAHFKLSKTGKNVVVLMLDRAIGSYLPYLFQEKPQLQEQFAGFTYYPKTLSFGGFTNFGAPALFGGYEYTPENMNARADKPLVEKHDEALKLMPAVFDQAGYEVTVCEPSYAGYQWIPDLTIFQDLPRIQTYLTESGQFTLTSPEEQIAQVNRVWERNFFCYSLMKCAPLMVQRYLYRGGTYFKPDTAEHMTAQTVTGMSRAEGKDRGFLNSYAFLHALPDITQLAEDGTNTFLMMSNSATHEPMLLQEPAYEPASVVDNTEYDETHKDRFIVNGREMHVENADQMKHYQSNMAAMLQLGRWFDWMREQGVYDNTRIIIAADHGRDLGQFDDWIFGTELSEDIMLFNPLLMVKDFDSKVFQTDSRFMTNADVPSLAFQDLIKDPVNPFSGNPVQCREKTAGELHIFGSRIWDVLENNGNTFRPGPWYALDGDMFDAHSWKKLGEY